MKYRITKSEKGYRAFIYKEIAYEGAYVLGNPVWIEIENDSPDLCYRERYYDTEREAIEACKRHQEENEYSKLPKIVREFEL